MNEIQEEKRVLICVGGITCFNYILQDLLQHKLFPAHLYERTEGKLSYPFKLRGKADAKYNYIEEVDCEHNFDSWSINTPLWDRAGDIFKAELNPWRMAAARRSLFQKIVYWKSRGYIVDLVLHSLGTVIAAGCGVEVNEIYMTGSPLTFSWALCRFMVNNELKNKPFIQAKKLFYLWNLCDGVCKNPFYSKRFKGEIINFETRPPYKPGWRQFDGHSWIDYAKELLANHMLVLDDISMIQNQTKNE